MLSTVLVLFNFLALALGSSIANKVETLLKKQVPHDANGVRTITSPNGISIRYKQPENEGVCEMTPGVNSYSGYIDIDEKTHMFFWFFEARTNPNTAPITLWLNGGPGADSMIGLFEELGPCYVDENGTSHINMYSWNEVSNLLFLSQPVGVGFSYENEVVGYVNQTTGHFTNTSLDEANSRNSGVDPYKTDTTALAAKVAWEVLQGFFENLPTLDERVQSRTFNLWTESYGGHYGPTFYRHFSEQNQLIQNGSAKGVELNMHTLGIINGLISASIQNAYYPEFAYNNTYGIQAINESMYNYAKMNYYFPEKGCRDSIKGCVKADRSTRWGMTVCAQASAICDNLVEGVYYSVTDLSAYDIRTKSSVPVPPKYWRDYLNMAEVQNALGVNVNYTGLGNNKVHQSFWYTGDESYPDILADLEAILDDGVRIALVYGDADYICNWFGGEAVSLQVNYTHSNQFRKAAYVPFVVDGVEYGQSRQYGNFSFTRVYNSGHEVPYYQPQASLELFRRVLADVVVSDGCEKVTPTSGSVA